MVFHHQFHFTERGISGTISCTHMYHKTCTGIITIHIDKIAVSGYEIAFSFNFKNKDKEVTIDNIFEKKEAKPEEEVVAKEVDEQVQESEPAVEEPEEAKAEEAPAEEAKAEEAPAEEAKAEDAPAEDAEAKDA